MPPSPAQGSGSLMLAEEYFDAEDSRFVDAIRGVQSPGALAGFVDRWRRDPRPFAREQILAYLSHPLDCPGHNVVVKRLFKEAESAGDDELMAAFLVAFDTLVRRLRQVRTRYDWQTREVWTEEVLVTPRNTLPREATVKVRDLWSGVERSIPARIPRNGRLFSYRTRHHLRRRAWRYFRRLGHQHPERYVAAVVRALAAYRDDDLAKGEHILDSWGLVHACFRAHEALEFTASRIRLQEGRSVGELTPAPALAPLWRTTEAGEAALGLVATARSRLVRLWAMELLRREHAAYLAGIPVENLYGLLGHPDEEVQQFGAELFEASGQTARLPVATWFRLLSTPNTLALETICRTFERQVASDRLTLADCLRLACAAPAPVARLGLTLLRDRAIASAEDREAIASLADSRSATAAGELATWALGILGGADVYDRELVLRFFDSRSAPVRRAAWQWLVETPDGETGNGDGESRSPGYTDPGLWCRLLETPYDDLRLPMVDELQRRASLPGAGADRLAPVWTSVLLGVHRGGRQKAKATQQIARALADDPSRADALLPVLAVAVRSVRAPETRAGLAAVMSALEARPEIGELVRRHLPELRWEVA